MGAWLNISLKWKGDRFVLTVRCAPQLISACETVPAGAKSLREAEMGAPAVGMETAVERGAVS